MQTTRLRRAGIAAVATAALVVPLAQATGAQQPTGARAPAVGETGRSIIHGQVVDSRTGKPLDDVHVEAVRVTARGEDVAASDLSYASPDNAITHGYFAMHVQRGSYRVTFDRPDYATTRVEVEKGQRDRAGLGSPVELVRLPATRISLSATRGRGLSVRTGRRIELDLRLSGKGARTSPTGTVAVSLERRSSAVATATVLRRRDGGRSTVDLGRAPAPGRYDVVVSYAGDAAHRSAEQAFTLRVVKKG